MLVCKNRKFQRWGSRLMNLGPQTKVCIINTNFPSHRRSITRKTGCPHFPSGPVSNERTVPRLAVIQQTAFMVIIRNSSTDVHEWPTLYANCLQRPNAKCGIWGVACLMTVLVKIEIRNRHVRDYFPTFYRLISTVELKKKVWDSCGRR